MRLGTIFLILCFAIYFNATDASAGGKWQKLENKPNCSVWDSTPDEGTDKKVNWQGDCRSGKTIGKGTLNWKWISSGKPLTRLYIGTMKNGKYDGRGAIQYSNGDKYGGDWKDHKRDGEGIYIWSDGRKYEGSFRDHVLHGQGVLTYADGTSYTGPFVNDKRHGIGTYRGKNGYVSVGEYKNDSATGKCEITFRDRSTYEGHCVNGLKDGKGVLSNSDGSRYAGSFNKDKFHGKGVFTFKDGSTYTGSFIQDKYHGEGTYVGKNGYVYVGEYKGDEGTGKCKFKFGDGAFYKGTCDDSNPDGKGVLKASNGSIHIGQWDNSLPKYIDEYYAIDRIGFHKINILERKYLFVRYEKTLVDVTPLGFGHGYRKGMVVEEGGWNVLTGIADFRRMNRSAQLKHCGARWLNQSDNLVNMTNSKGKPIPGVLVSSNPGSCAAMGFNPWCSPVKCLRKWSAGKDRKVMIPSYELAKKIWDKSPKPEYERSITSWSSVESDGVCTSSDGYWSDDCAQQDLTNFQIMTGGFGKF